MKNTKLKKSGQCLTGPKPAPKTHVRSTNSPFDFKNVSIVQCFVLLFNIYLLGAHTIFHRLDAYCHTFCQLSRSARFQNRLEILSGTLSHKTDSDGRRTASPAACT